MRLRSATLAASAAAMRRRAIRRSRAHRRQPQGAARASLFVALPGTKADGARFVAEARRARAPSRSSARPTPAAGLAGDRRSSRVADPRRALALAAARFYPRQPATIVAVTGTSGKTSVAAFARQICAALGRKAASLGTHRRRRARPARLRLADHARSGRAARDARRARRARASPISPWRPPATASTSAGSTACGSPPAAFTNLGRDHLDYHPTIEDYLAAKLRLFDDAAAARRRRPSSTPTAPCAASVVAAARGARPDAC